MNQVVGLQQVMNLHSVARDMTALLAEPANADIAYLYPGSHALFSGDLTSVVNKLILESAYLSAGNPPDMDRVCGGASSRNVLR